MSRPERDSGRRGRPTVALIVGAAVLVVAALVLSIAGRSGTSRRGTAGPNVAGPIGSVPGQSSPAGQPVAAGHDQAGAVGAARAIVAVEPALVAGDDDGAAQLVASWAAASSMSSLTDQLRQYRASFTRAPGGPYSFEVAPLAAKVNAASPDDMTVQLWCAEVVFAKGKPSYGSYVTQTLHLIWEGGTWRLVATVDTPGPAVPLAPGKAPTSIEETTSKLAGFAPAGLAGQGS